MRKVPETQEDQRARLRKTAEGLAFLALIDQFPTKRALAAALGSSVRFINRCITNGQISKSGAQVADEKGFMAKEVLRPDVTDWESIPPGLKVGEDPVRDGDYQVLLRDLAIHFKSVRNFCQVSGCSVRSFHDWNTRNRIPSATMLKLVAMTGLNRELRAQIKALVDKAAAG